MTPDNSRNYPENCWCGPENIHYAVHVFVPGKALKVGATKEIILQDSLQVVLVIDVVLNPSRTKLHTLACIGQARSVCCFYVC